MRVLLSKLTYANVVATIALFLALSGGAVMAAGQLGKNVVKSGNIAPKAVKTQDLARGAVKPAKLAANAVKNKNLAKNSVSGAKVRKGTLTRSKLKAGTLAGLQVADVQAPSVPGLSDDPPSTGEGVPIPLAGTATFTPKAGKSYMLLAEMRGTPVDNDDEEFFGCFAGARIYVNGYPVAGVFISAFKDAEPPSPKVEPVGNTSVGVGMLVPGQPQTIAANALGSDGCSSATTAVMRITVVELG